LAADGEKRRQQHTGNVLPNQNTAETLVCSGAGVLIVIGFFTTKRGLSMLAVYYGLKGFFLLSLARSYVVYDALQKQWLIFPIFYTAGLALLSWVFILGMNPGIPADAWKIWLAKSFVLVVIYFKLLSKFEDGFLFWIIFFGGWLGLIYY
jgi:hypothetical protein